MPENGEWRSEMDDDRLRGIIDFLQSAERLKDTLRSGVTAKGRAESVAEHTWRLCLMVMLFNRELKDCDMLRLLKLCIVHDLGEAISGDVPAVNQHGDDGRAARERADLVTLCAPLEEDLGREIIDLWDEYNRAASPEAVYAKGFDKLETMLQHVVGKNAPDFDYEFNLGYGMRQTERHPLLRQVRVMVDDATRARLKDSRQ